ncbi:PP2C family protein-serine/threonine phosphatase [Fusobacterium animalis]|uniref:SpoIIE family protein phosphatase n=1 Tax=Fusobacterium animalis TaxID=76859 RepID=UPI003247AD9C
MITAFYMIIAFLIYIFFTYIYIKRIVNQYINEELKIISGLKNKEKLDKLPDNIKTEYTETLEKIIKQENELNNSIDEIKEYRKELDVTYSTLVSKSTQLEYTNSLLERRVRSLSNLNHISRVALSMFNIDKIVDTLADAYFVLTATTRISIYLWEGENLVNKKIKGSIDYTESLSYPMYLLEKFTNEDYSKIYSDLSRKITILNDEKVIITPLKVKERQLGVIFLVQNKDQILEINSEMISALGIQASIAIDNAINYAELLEKERISQELELASSIQKQILPKGFERIKGMDIATHFSPAKEIGGDYYDLSVTIADVSGKGVPAAFLMALSRSMLKTINYVSNYTPAEELDLFNKIVYPDITEDMFITVMNAEYNLDTSLFTYSSAGHNPLVIYKKENDTIELYGTKGVAIGFIEDYNYKENSFEVKSGDIIVFYTDGIIECENKDRKLFGTQRLVDIVYKNKNLSAKELKEKILKGIENFREDYEQNDDITFVILKSVK